MSSSDKKGIQPKHKSRESGLDLPLVPFSDRLIYNPVKKRCYLFPETFTDQFLFYWKAIAKSDEPVLITGETGTGKEDLADLIAAHSKRPLKKYGVIHCGAIPETLIDSELFGHVKGAATDLNRSRPGRLAALDGGTVFLDEIGAMPPSSQVRLLRLLQDHEIQPVGADRVKKLDVRIIAATRSPDKINEDVKYRFGVSLHLPPLRDRSDDLLHLLLRFFFPYDIFSGIDLYALFSLMCYQWSGNIRELKQFCDSFQLIHRERPKNVEMRQHPYIVESEENCWMYPCLSFMPHDEVSRVWDALANNYATCRILQLLPEMDKPETDNTLRLLRCCIADKSEDIHPPLSFETLITYWNKPDLYDIRCIRDFHEVESVDELLRWECRGVPFEVVANSMRYLVRHTREEPTDSDKNSAADLLLVRQLKKLLSPQQIAKSSDWEAIQQAWKPFRKDTTLQQVWGEVSAPSETRKRFGEMYRSLDGEKQTILQLKMKGMSLGQIEDRTGIPKSTVHEKIQELRDRCREYDPKWVSILRESKQDE